MGAVKAAMIEQQEAATLETLQKALDKLAVAVDHLVDERDELLEALKTACGFLTNARIDLATGCTKATAINTIDGGLKIVRAVITRAESRP